MAVDLAELGLRVRSDGVVTADKRLRDLEKQTLKTETATQRLVRQTEKLSKQMDAVGKTMALRITAPLLIASGAAVRFAGNFENSFANIRKTVDATEPEFAKMSAEIRQMAKEIPTAVEELNNLGGVAGQLGVESRNIVAFTRTIAMLGDTTDIAGEQAALSLSRFMNIMGTAQSQIDRIGSTVVGLGNNFAAMESEIVDGATSLASFGRQLNFTEAQVLAFSTAIAASGGEQEAASSAFQKTAITMQRAVLEMNEDLAIFARISKTSAEEFSRVFREDAAGAMVLFLQGLKDVSDEGRSTSAVLEELSLTDIRLQREFGKVIGNLDQLKGALEIANTEWESNTALTEEAMKRYETFNSEMTILWNNIKDFGITIGNDLIPVVRTLSGYIRDLVDDLQELSPEVRSNIILFSALAAAVGPLLIVLAALVRSVTILTPLVVSMAGAITAIGVVAAAAATEIERRFIPGMEEVGRTEQILNVLIRTWVILRETALGVGEVVLGVGISMAGLLRGIFAPVEAAIRSLHTALSELSEGNFSAAASALSVGNMWEEVTTAMGKAEKMIKSGLGFSIEANNKRIEEAVDNVNDLRRGLLVTGSEGEKATEKIEEGFDESSKAAENFLDLLKQISTVELPKVTLVTSTLLPQIATESEKLINALEREKEALEEGGEAWTAYERAMFQAQAVAELGEKATVDQIEAVQKLAGAIFDLRNETSDLGAESERAFKRFFVELSSNGDSAFRNLAESFRHEFVESIADELFDLVDDFTDSFGEAGDEISQILKAAIMGSVEGTEEAILAALGSAIGQALGGPVGGQIGAMIGEWLGGMFGGGTPSSNAGLLMGARENFSGVDAERLFGSFDLFGQEAQLFARREDQDAAIAASRQFIALEESIGASLETIGLDLDQFSINLRGLDENAQGMGAFLGQAAEEGEAVGRSVAMQLLDVARQSIKQIAAQSDGLIPPDVLNDILFPRGAATVVGDVTAALNDFFSTLSEAEQERLQSAQKINEEILRLEQKRQEQAEKDFESAIERTSKFLESITDPISDLMTTIRNDIAAITGEFSSAVDSIINNQIRQLDDLRRAAIANHADEIRQEEELHNTRLRLADSLAQFALNLRTGDLSPLSNRARFELAQDTFQSTLAAAMGGDVAAAERLQGAAQSYAELSREMFASSTKHVDNMDEILSGLDSAAGLLGASEFNPQEANDRLVTELQLINSQLAALPTGISSSLAPFFDQMLLTGLAAGQSMQQIATRIESIIATIPAGVAGSTPPTNPVAEYAFTEKDARNAVNQVIDSANGTFDIVSRSAAILKDMGFSAGFLQQLFPGTDIFGLLDTYGIPHFEKGGAVMQDGPAMLHRNEHVVNADRDNLVVNVQSNSEGIGELREIMKEIRDNDKRYQEEEIKLAKDNQRSLSNLTEAVRKSA